MNSQGLATLAVPVNANDHVRGSKNASVTLVEYGDYECPYCGQAHYVVQQLEDVAAGTVSSISDVVSLSAWPTTVENLK
jgi:protein-disulfide isomerase